jgi:hypothetical protein
MKIVEKLRPVHEQRMRLLALGAGFPAVIAALALLWRADYTLRMQWPITIVILFVWWTCASAIRQRVASPLRTLANLLEAMREGDYSIRGLGTGGEDALSEVMQQVNAMSAISMGARREISNTPIPCPWRTASPRMARASGGRKWWKAVKMVRNPGRSAGTAVASTADG